LLLLADDTDSPAAEITNRTHVNTMTHLNAHGGARRLRLPSFLVIAMLAGTLVLTACDATVTPLDDTTASIEVLTAESRSNAITSAQVNRLLAAARGATARYHDVEAAEDDEFVQFTPCVEDETKGGMGYHWVNFGNVVPPHLLDVTSPQALVYEPMKNGRKRLVAIEYIVPYALSDTPPMLFGQHFQPAPPGWALHVWIWKNNPSGMFAGYNPNVSCQYSQGS
jgi:hypothetical protein